ncbi:unnamed protein product [Pseudo-nitzschia multistriata]|uniref:Uncharacterized protein n=1 Tax=Pseudo-nitzschia multistriata TaxID=183589 RepID=A0A448Z9Y0_9STRA|nr:unnamed protein product [Pseudo-nitzschia multistriata]
MNGSTGRKRSKPDSTSSIVLTPAAEAVASPSERCWKCKGRGKKFQKSTQCFDGPSCKVCNGAGIRKRSKRSQILASEPGKILNLRGYPADHVLRTVFPDGFAGPRAVWGGTHASVSDAKVSDKNTSSNNDTVGDLPRSLLPREGEVVGSLGCGDWRIYQISDGNKLTVDDFVCAWVAAEEMRKRGHGSNLHRSNPVIAKKNDDNGGIANDGAKMFGGRIDAPEDKSTSKQHRFNHADIGTGCGSVLMMTAWAFLGEIQSIGVEAQDVSFGCVKRGLEWNLGSDGTSPYDAVQVRQNDLRTWDGYGISIPKSIAQRESTTPHTERAGAISGENKKDPTPSTLGPPYHLITGTPPYFPLDSFVASQNHEQKVRCRVPTRGGAPDYIATASRFLLEEESDETTSANHVDAGSHATNSGGGVFCMVEAAFDKAEAGVLAAVEKHNMRVQRRVDVITRTGLPPRFSCWIMTKKKVSTNHKKAIPTNNLSKNETNDNAQTVSDADGNRKEIKRDNSSEKSPFPIETLTLRNADLSRTKEYTNAMEIMGWVDFEKSRHKTVKKLPKEDESNF